MLADRIRNHGEAKAIQLMQAEINKRFPMRPGGPVVSIEPVSPPIDDITGKAPYAPGTIKGLPAPDPNDPKYMLGEAMVVRGLPVSLVDQALQSPTWQYLLKQHGGDLVKAANAFADRLAAAYGA